MYQRVHEEILTGFAGFAGPLFPDVLSILNPAYYLYGGTIARLHGAAGMSEQFVNNLPVGGTDLNPERPVSDDDYQWFCGGIFRVKNERSRGYILMLFPWSVIKDGALDRSITIYTRGEVLEEDIDEVIVLFLLNYIGIAAMDEIKLQRTNRDQRTQESVL